MRSPDAAFIILLATLFSFAIRDSNETYVDPRNLWTLVKQATSNGNQFLSNWFQSTFCRPNEKIDMNGISSVDMNMETGTEQSEQD